MKTSCGSIIVYKNKILICRPRWDNPYWNIPKGVMNEGESHFETAVRETFEECNIDINKNFKKIEDIGLLPYLKNKNLYLYLVEISELPELKCNSFYEYQGKKRPEFVDFKWIDIDEFNKYLSKGLINVFLTIKSKINKLIKGEIVK